MGPGGCLEMSPRFCFEVWYVNRHRDSFLERRVYYLPFPEERAYHALQSHAGKHGGVQCQEGEEARGKQRPRALVAASTRRNG